MQKEHRIFDSIDIDDSSILSVLGEPLVMPEQFFSRQTIAHQGEIKLMLAVLADATECFLKGFEKDTIRSFRLRQEAKDWFFSDDERWPFSCINICSVFDIDIEALRQRLMRLADAYEHQLAA